MIIKLNDYKKEIEAIDKEVDTLPIGRLVKKGNYYYHVIKGKEVAITKNTNIISKLCRKRYILARKQQLAHNTSILSDDPSQFDDTSPKELIQSFPSTYQDFPYTYFFHPSIEKWLSISHQKNSYPAEEGHYFSNNDILFRSKFEVFIANQLEEYGLPYFYDIALKLGSKKVYPDFIIKKPFNGKTIIWEHFGALHQSEYEQAMNHKMTFYMNHGYIPLETIIYTFESDIKQRNRLKYLIENIIL